MPLTWHLGKVNHYKNNPDDIWVKTNQFGFEMEDVNPEAKAFIFGMISVGMSSISETNVSEFYGRWKVIEMLDGIYVTAMLTENGELEKTFMTPNLAKKYINLSTNASKLSLTNWASAVSKQYPKYSTADIKSMVNFYSLEYKNEMDEL